jgi:hypothetical protein
MRERCHEKPNTVKPLCLFLIAIRAFIFSWRNDNAGSSTRDCPRHSSARSPTHGSTLRVIASTGSAGRAIHL